MKNVPGQYKRTILHSCPDFEVVRCSWSEGDYSALHEHFGSRCSLQVEQGTFENVTQLGFSSQTQVLKEGDAVSTPIGAKHQLRCTSEHGVTLHVYIPRIAAHHDEVFTPLTPSEIRQNLDLSLGEKGCDWNELERAVKDVKRQSISTSSPFFMNQLFSGVFPESYLSSELITATRATLATAVGSPVLTEIEKEVVEKLGAIIGWGAGQRGGITVPGGSFGNFYALHCARQRKIESAKLFGNGNHSFTIYVSSEAHYSFKKAAAVLGLGTESVREIAVDEAGKLCPRHLIQQLERDTAAGREPLMLAATAGTTVSGAFDDIAALSEIAHSWNLWLHVDAAWGAPAFFSTRTRNLMFGSERADSFTFDAHKFFGANLVTSFFLTKHPSVLLEANDVGGSDYLFHEAESVDRGKLSWQCGRGAEAVNFWTIWKSAGTEGFATTLDALLNVREQVVEWIASEPRLRLVGPTPQFLNICVEVTPPQPDCSFSSSFSKSDQAADDNGSWSERVRNELIAQNKCMVNFSSDADGRTFLRLILVNPALKTEHVISILRWTLDVGGDSAAVGISAAASLACYIDPLNPKEALINEGEQASPAGQP